MRNTIIAMSIAATVAFAPLESEARADRNGLDACAQAMTEQLAGAQGAPLDYRLNEGPDTTGNRARVAGTWYLDAKHPESQAVVARIDCRVNSRAQVVSLKQLPLSAHDAGERADIE